MEFSHYASGMAWPLLYGPALHTIALSFAKAALTMLACGCTLGLIHLSIRRGTQHET